jgi:hypothetical protein
MPVSAVSSTDQPALGRSIAFRLAENERASLVGLARRHDRTPGAEVRRAVRFYLANFESVDRALRQQASPSGER